MKGYVIEKQTTTKYEVIDMIPFMKYDFFTNARKGMCNTPKTCFRCGHKFIDSDMIYLGVVKGDKNRIFCESCGKHIQEIFETQK